VTSDGPHDEQRQTPASRPVVVESTEGAWREQTPPDAQGRFRCVVHGRGSRIERRAEPQAASPKPQGGPVMPGGAQLLPGGEFYVAIDNVCAWPNLTLLPSGEIVAAVYNHPSHGFGCGNVELWASADGGRLWAKRSTVSDHADQPDHVRMNHAVGLDADGHLVALVSGWSEGRRAPILDIQICRSTDAGRTWERAIWPRPVDERRVPFGDIVARPDGVLTAACYGKTGEAHHAYTCRSSDGGRSWGDLRPLAENHNETALVRLASGAWLAASRGSRCTVDYGLIADTTSALTLSRSDDDGLTWAEQGVVTPQGQYPGHLLQLADGRVVLTYGSRIVGLYGAAARISDDDGNTWSRAQVLVATHGPMDCGYPSTVELPDGTLVTAYYAGARTHPKFRHTCPYALPWHQRYHMGVCRWRPDVFA